MAAYEAVKLVPEIQVEALTFLPTLNHPPGSTNSFFLGGAGVRTVQIPDKILKVTAIGVYLEEKSIPVLAVKWKGKTADELSDSVEFFRDIVIGPFEKFMMVTMILPLTGQLYSEKVAERCVEIWKDMGIHSEEKGKVLEKFIQAFQEENLPPGSSILFTQSSPNLTIAFSKDGSIPKEGKAVIENKLLSEAIFEAAIGKDGVSPAARRSLAVRISELLKAEGGEAAENTNKVH